MPALYPSVGPESPLVNQDGAFVQLRGNALARRTQSRGRSGSRLDVPGTSAMQLPDLAVK